MTTKKSYRSLIEALIYAPIVSYDLETQSDSQGKKGNMEHWHPHSRVVTASYTVPGEGTWVVPLSHPQGPWTAKWKQLFHNFAKAIKHKEKTKIVAHNIMYEIKWTYSMTGFCLIDQAWWDTMMSAYILDENLPANLKDTAVRDLGVEPWADVDLKDPESVELSKLMLYNARDTDYAYRLVPVHKERLLAEPRLARLFKFHGMQIVKTLAEIERVGMPLDVEKVIELQKESKKIVEANTKRLMKKAEKAGMDIDSYPTVSFGTTNKFFSDFMEAMEFPVVSYTPAGAPSWKADNLDILVDQGFKVAQLVADTRLHASRDSKFFKPWLEKVDDNGRLHPSFNPMLVDDKYDKAKGTKTGRLSSSNPNAQQIARALKPCYGGTEGWLILELDYSQIELRIMAWLAGVTKVIRAYEKGKDLHKLMAALITGKSIDEIDGNERQKGKAGNFGFIFDMSAQGFVTYAYDNYKVKVSLEESNEIRRAFFDDQWTGLDKWHERQRILVAKNGFVRNPIGRKRRLPEVYSGNPYEVGRAERRAINFPVQSFAADLMCLSLIEIQKNIDPSKARLIGTVHDSLLAEVREDSYQETIEGMARTMLDPGTEKRFGVKVGVPLEVEAKIGYHWAHPEAEVRVFTTS